MGAPKQPKIPPGGGFGRGCKISYLFFEGGGAVRPNWKPLWLHPGGGGQVARAPYFRQAKLVDG